MYLKLETWDYTLLRSAYFTIFTEISVKNVGQIDLNLRMKSLNCFREEIFLASDKSLFHSLGPV